MLTDAADKRRDPSGRNRAATKAKNEIDVPWDEMRAARVHRRALEAFKAARDSEEHPAEGMLGEEMLGEEPGPESVGPQRDHALEPSDDVVLAPKRWHGSRRARLLVVAALVAVAATIALFVRLGDTIPPPAWSAASTLHYSDGSRSLLAERAEVHVVEDAGDHVLVSQAAGRVRYEIVPRPERRFVVGAAGVTITVLGTVFDVNVEGARVEVLVERGRVRVESGDRLLELTAGEHVTVVGEIDESAVAPHAASKLAHAAEGEAEGADHDAPTPPNPNGTPLIEEGTEADARVSDTPDGTQPSEAQPSAAQPSAAEWMHRADVARAEGRLDDALSALGSLIASYPTDPRATLALFTIGRVERKRGHHTAAAAAFEGCGAALRGDAYAEAAASWLSAGAPGKAKAAAQRYLAAFPTGVHAEQMRKLAGGP